MGFFLLFRFEMCKCFSINIDIFTKTLTYLKSEFLKKNINFSLKIIIAEFQKQFTHHYYFCNSCGAMKSSRAIYIYLNCILKIKNHLIIINLNIVLVEYA
jgi:hypothetical protein